MITNLKIRGLLQILSNCKRTWVLDVLGFQKVHLHKVYNVLLGLHGTFEGYKMSPVAIISSLPMSKWWSNYLWQKQLKTSRKKRRRCLKQISYINQLAGFLQCLLSGFHMLVGNEAITTGFPSCLVNNNGSLLNFSVNTENLN